MIFINKTKGNKMSTENNITLIECSHCSEEIEEDLRESNLCDPCEENTSVCVVCNERTDDDDINTVEDEQYCCDCVFDHYITCDGCGEWVDIDRYHYREETESRYCSNCVPRDIIRNYSWKPTPIFHTQLGEELSYNNESTKEKRIVFGFELEVENYDKVYTNEQLANALKDRFGSFLYFKHDGSLNDGFEIISHPMTYTYFKNHKQELKAMLTIIKEHGFRSYDSDSCGLHITLTRKCFAHSHFLKFVDFFNSSSNFELLRALSQRTSSSSNWGQLKNEYTKHVLIDFAKCKNGRQNTSRNRALNLGNHNTIEVRLFRGTLKVSSFFKAFESVLSIYDYTYKMSFTSLKINNPKLDKHSENVRSEILKNANLSGFIAPITNSLIKRNYFVSFVASNKKQFPNLNNFMIETDSANYKIHSMPYKINELNKLINNERVYI